MSENVFDFKQLLNAFNEDNKTTVKEIQKNLDEQRISNLKGGLKKNTKKVVPPPRQIDTKKLFA